MTESDVRTVLVPDLDGELLVPLRALEEVLLSLSMWEDDDVEDPPEDREPLALPEPLANGYALAGLLDLEATDDSRLLVERLRVNPPERDLALTDAEERAYARTADRLNHMWAHGSGIDRFLY